MSGKLPDSVVAMLFARIAALDSRKTSREAVQAFAAALVPMTPEDAIRAVDHHRETSTDWLMPAHLNRIVKAWREERVRQAGQLVPPPELADDPVAEIRWRRETVEAIADGTRTVKQVGA